MIELLTRRICRTTHEPYLPDGDGTLHTREMIEDALTRFVDDERRKI